MSQHLTRLEHELIPVTADGSDDSLSMAEAEVLSQVAETRRGFCERRYRSVRLAQFCGVVNLGQRVLEVLPKVGDRPDVPNSRGVLLRLLRAAATGEGLQLPPATQRLERSPLLEIFISLFMDSVTTVLRGGLLRQYKVEEDDLRVVRGRIDLTRQLGVHFNRPDLVASRFDELTADNVWNRSIKAALTACRPWISSGELQRRWVELIAAFEDVADVVMTTHELDRLVYDRQAVRYRQTMDWVRWILTLLSPGLRMGSERAPAFLFDMNAIFEGAVANVLRQRLAKSHPELDLHPQATGRHLARLGGHTNRRAYALRPDMLVSAGRRVVTIADAKWKRIELSHAGHLKPTRSDMYQMHAYASAYEADRLALIYPAHSGIKGARETTFLLPRVGSRQPAVSIVCIDVERDDLPIVIGAESLLYTPVCA